MEILPRKSGTGTPLRSVQNDNIDLIYITNDYKITLADF